MKALALCTSIWCRYIIYDIRKLSNNILVIIACANVQTRILAENRLNPVEKWSERKCNHCRGFHLVNTRIASTCDILAFTETRDVNSDFRKDLIRVRNTGPPYIVANQRLCKYGLNCVPLGGDNCESTLLHTSSRGKSAKFHYRRSLCFSSH